MSLRPLRAVQENSSILAPTPSVPSVPRFERYPHLSPLLPAMGYSEHQRQEMEETIHRTTGDLVLIATPGNLGLILNIDRAFRRVGYEVVCRNLANTCSNSCARSAVLP